MCVGVHEGVCLWACKYEHEVCGRVMGVRVRVIGCLGVCVGCVCACVCACARACVHVRVCVCSRAMPACVHGVRACM